MRQDIFERLKSYQPSPAMLPKDFKEAAVLVPIIKKAQPELVLTQRASGLSTHSGEVAFPGGKRDFEDKTLLQTALRETEEEVAIAPQQVEIIGSLQTVVSHHYLKVTPYVGLIDKYYPNKINSQEIAAIFSVPLSYFKKDPRVVTHRIDYLGKDWYVPCYEYNNFKIWGLTAIMIVELVNVLYDLQIPLHEKPATSHLIDLTHLKQGR